MSPTNRLTALSLFLPCFFSLAHAQNSRNSSNSTDGLLCKSLERYTFKFNEYNATKEYSIPALRINGTLEGNVTGGVVEDPDNEWRLRPRIHLAPNKQTADFDFFLDTGDSDDDDLEGMGVCMETTWVSEGESFAFSKDVLMRSINDNGDCRTMLGNECVEGLKRHYQTAARRQMFTGQCNSGSWNTTIPYECAGLVGGKEKWNSGMFLSGISLNNTDHFIEEYGCDNTDGFDIQDIGDSIHYGGGYGGNYDHYIRFPTPHFLTFFPNRTGQGQQTSDWDSDVHIEIKCLRPDDVKEGSTVPATAEQILGDKDTKFDKDATGAAGSFKPLMLYLGATAMAAMLLA